MMMMMMVMSRVFLLDTNTDGKIEESPPKPLKDSKRYQYPKGGTWNDKISAYVCEEIVRIDKQESGQDDRVSFTDGDVVTLDGLHDNAYKVYALSVEGPKLYRRRLQLLSSKANDNPQWADISRAVIASGGNESHWNEDNLAQARKIFLEGSKKFKEAQRPPKTNEYKPVIVAYSKRPKVKPSNFTPADFSTDKKTNAYGARKDKPRRKTTKQMFDARSVRANMDDLGGQFGDDDDDGNQSEASDEGEDDEEMQKLEAKLRMMQQELKKKKIEKKKRREKRRELKRQKMMAAMEKMKEEANAVESDDDNDSSSSREEQGKSDREIRKKKKKKVKKTKKKRKHVSSSSSDDDSSECGGGLSGYFQMRLEHSKLKQCFSRSVRKAKRRNKRRRSA